MRSYWLWFLLFGLTWWIGLSFHYWPFVSYPIIMLASALFFSLYFLLPLVSSQSWIYMLMLIAMGLVCFLVFHPNQLASVSFFSFLLYILIAGEAFYRLSGKYVVITYISLVILAVLPYLSSYGAQVPIAIMVTASLLGIALVAFYQVIQHQNQISEQFEALQSEFRSVKRRLVTSDKLARQEERAQIARDMHDSVGHQLTGLLMQLEVMRMQAEDEEIKEQLTHLKTLAKTSLEETRAAVKTLKSEETGGLTAIIGLIRKLEAESHVRITFSIKHGALTAPLLNEQVVALYRVVQEALTNMMRHGEVKEATILFESVAQNYFHFEIRNPYTKAGTVQEGFGLNGMRERMQQVGGRVDIQKINGEFVVNGMIPMEKEMRLE
ncbi:sensor histidine kinase LnrJ [Paraliobacillus ryukyuensis]|uniref:histidine kinase n=1 Tax=Paraliobacillus ryukyuensis TaxID=200904 RepID=A0A366DYQ8_9BACI|nr:sensor histidine kinase [Paraliobacillus ryukyuensis]RBO95223.1 signal transduction histidine kinase [Paraliobacillus ryukyuensis]